MLRLKTREVSAGDCGSAGATGAGTAGRDGADARAKLGVLTPQQEEAMEAMTRASLTRLRTGRLRSCGGRRPIRRAFSSFSTIRKVFRFGEG